MNRRTFLRSTSLAAAGLLLVPRALRGSSATAVTPAATTDLLASLSEQGDLRLPAWGPYTKHLAGISHLPDLASGMRFDLSVFPGLYRRRQQVPMVTYDSGFQPWSATPGLERYTLRFPLGELESFYADVTFAPHDGGALVRTQLVNRTPQPQQLSLNFLASLHFPEAGPYRQPPLRAAHVTLPEGGTWIDGSHYRALAMDDDAPQRHLADNAELWGEVRRDGCVNGVALARGFGRVAGQRATYSAPDGFAATGTVALFRVRLAPQTRTTLRCTGLYAGEIALVGTGDFQLAAVQLADTATPSEFSVEAAGGDELELDGIALVPAAQQSAVEFHVPPLDYQPKLTPLGESALLLAYAAVPGCYGLAWIASDSEVREWLTDRIEYDFPLYTHEHIKRRLELGGQRHYTNVFVRPLFLAPGETREFTAFVCHASDKAVTRAALARFAANAAPALVDAPTLPAHTAAGRDYAYGVERLAATVATNVVYPVRRRGKFIRHYCPGRWWDSLYTWDAGFIGLGLLELDPARSVDNLAAYLARPEEDAAFTFHGSPVPVQIYQLQALWNRTQDRAVLARFFPGVRRMHRFLAGRSEGSNTRTLRSGLLRTWDYFYNPGGWDDYPPQKFVRGTALTRNTTPVVNTAHAIRTARLLRGMAQLLGEPTAEFDADIASLTDALQTHAWDAASGWFSYVRHDAEGRAIGPLRHESGENFNRGTDGIYPLVAGACTAEQEKLFLQRLRDPRVFWSDVGLTTVDQSAAYYRDDGYWNGTVWMPHQWFFWRALLDLGEGNLAWQIAQTALRTWEREVRATGCSFEHFIVKSGCGAGWHQFGGLSSPILSWFAAYFRPGTLTGGYDCWILEQETSLRSLRARVRLTGAPEKSPVVLAVINASAESIRWKGRSIHACSRASGMIEIVLPSGADEGVLSIGEL